MNTKGKKVLILLYKMDFCCLNLLGCVPVHATKKMPISTYLWAFLFYPVAVSRQPRDHIVNNIPACIGVVMQNYLMRGILLLLACMITFNGLYAQGWGADIGLGLSYARLLRSAESTKQTESIRYSFGQPGICISPEIFLTLNEHSRVIFSYQLSENKTGIQFRAGRGAGSHEFNYEQFQLHNFSVGYCHFRNIAHDKVWMGLLVKVGLANGIFVGSGYGESGSGSMQGYVQTQPVASGNIMSSFWMPDATIGITLSPPI